MLHSRNATWYRALHSHNEIPLHNLGVMLLVNKTVTFSTNGSTIFMRPVGYSKAYQVELFASGPNLSNVVKKELDHLYPGGTFYSFNDGWFWLSERTSWLSFSDLTIGCQFRKGTGENEANMVVVAAGGGEGALRWNAGSHKRTINQVIKTLESKLERTLYQLEVIGHKN